MQLVACKQALYLGEQNDLRENAQVSRDKIVETMSSIGVTSDDKNNQHPSPTPLHS